MWRPRQYIVTHLKTGEQTVVLGREEQRKDGYWRQRPQHASALAGYRYPADCDVTSVPYGQEYALPFDEVPLVIKSAKQPQRIARSAA